MKKTFTVATNIFGDPIEDQSPKDNQILYDNYIYPPFSVLDTTQGWWLNRKQLWIDLGIDSEVGRDVKGLDTYRWVKSKGLTGLAGDHSGISIFDPVLAELMYNWYTPQNGEILDPFAGGSVRGIVAAECGYRYTGIDLRQEQIEANLEQAKILSENSPKPNWIVGDSNVVLDTLEKSHYDFLFSCPPYHDLEKYSQDPADISNMEYDKFLELFESIVKKSYACMKDDTFACFVVGEIRNKKSSIGKYRNFVGHTIDLFENSGYNYYNEFIIKNSVGSLPIRIGKQWDNSRKLGKHHQNVLVFVNGDPVVGTKKIKGSN